MIPPTRPQRIGPEEGGGRRRPRLDSALALALALAGARGRGSRKKTGSIDRGQGEEEIG